MAKLATPLTELSDDSVFLTTILPYAAYIILAVACFQLLRVVISILVTALRTLVRMVLLVISWPVYLVLLPARALVFFTKLMLKLMLYAAIAAILYKLLGGPQNSVMIKETFVEVSQPAVMEMEVILERRVEMEVILERKVTKLLKAWAPVLVLMGLLIAVDTFDSAAGESLLSMMQHTITGFGTRGFHLQLPAHRTHTEMSEKDMVISKLRKGRHLLQ